MMMMMIIMMMTIMKIVWKEHHAIIVQTITDQQRQREKTPLCLAYGNMPNEITMHNEYTDNVESLKS